MPSTARVSRAIQKCLWIRQLYDRYLQEDSPFSYFLVQSVHRLSVFPFTAIKPRILLLDVVLSCDKRRTL